VPDEEHARRLIDDDALDAERYQIGARLTGRTNSLQQSRYPFSVQRDEVKTRVTSSATTFVAYGVQP
jgi:hypothetical protein